MTGSPGDEPVEAVDPDGRVERIVSRREMRAGNLRHRATFVVVQNGHGDVLVHQRARWKDIWPSRWDLAFGGVCGVGETWDVAARREVQHVQLHAERARRVDGVGEPERDVELALRLAARARDVAAGAARGVAEIAAE